MEELRKLLHMLVNSAGGRLLSEAEQIWARNVLDTHPVLNPELLGIDPAQLATTLAGAGVALSPAEADGQEQAPAETGEKVA